MCSHLTVAMKTRKVKVKVKFVDGNWAELIFSFNTKDENDLNNTWVLFLFKSSSASSAFGPLV